MRGKTLRNHLQVGLPHVAAYKLQLRTSFLSKKTKEPKQRLGRPVRANPQQPLAPLVDLIHQCLVLVTTVPLDFVDPNRLHSTEVAMRIEHNNHYYAMIDQMLANEDELDPDQSVQAKFQLAQLNQDYDQTYSNEISPKELKRRSTDLRQLAAKRLAPLDDQARDQLVRDAMARQTQWNPFPDASIAMMEKMVRDSEFQDSEFQGDVRRYAADQVAQELEGEYPDFDEETPYEVIQKQRAAVQAAVNAKVATLDPDERQALIADTQSRYPDWYGQNMSPEQRKKNVEAALDEIGTDGTFLGSLKAVFGLQDFIWLLQRPTRRRRSTVKFEGRNRSNRLKEAALGGDYLPLS